MDPARQIPALRLQAQQRLEKQQEDLFRTLSQLWDIWSDIKADGNREIPRGRDDMLVTSMYRKLCDYSLQFMKAFPAHGGIHNDFLFELRNEINNNSLKVNKILNILEYHATVFESVHIYYYSAGVKPSMFNCSPESFRQKIREIKQRFRVLWTAETGYYPRKLEYCHELTETRTSKNYSSDELRN